MYYNLLLQGESGSCRCPAGTVPWKWRCYAVVPGLHSQPCEVTPQCRIDDDPNREEGTALAEGAGLLPRNTITDFI